MSQTEQQAIKIEQSWLDRLKGEFQKPYFINLKAFLVKERQHYTIYPPGGQIFEAFNRTPFNNVKVVILGQDPYHGAGQAHGLCFSVNKGIVQPPSLKNIIKEIESDTGDKQPAHGDLSEWAEQGVFLLNTSLTVRAAQANSHQNQGWETFTDEAIKQLAQHRQHLVFMLWGSKAHAKEKYIDASKHLILKTVHPSPLSAYNGFFGCKHFSQCNEYLKAHGIEPINWSRS
ncbi:MAG TPA: uracil-DNA glycosylase [Flavobacteriales bacterium]|nr:uracil-DNA glycosylase [Flavobacteriales bacterium]